MEPILIFTWGNPSRGDDALGTLVHERMQQQDLAGADLLTDFQLQIEHAVDLEHRDCILFVDASVTATEPYEFARLHAVEDSSYSTHSMSPQSLLAVYEKVNSRPPPPAFLLSIRGYEFGLGLPLSGQAAGNLDKAIDFINRLLTASCESWPELTQG